MRLRIFGLLLLIFLAAGCDDSSAKQAQSDNAHAEYALGVIKRSTFVFDPGTQACWVFFDGYRRGSLAPVSCTIARRRMTPHLLEILENTERRLGYKIE